MKDTELQDHPSLKDRQPRHLESKFSSIASSSVTLGKFLQLSKFQFFFCIERDGNMECYGDRENRDGAME